MLRTMTVIRVVSFMLVWLALGCEKPEPTMSSLAEKNRTNVEAFVAQLLEVEAKLATIPQEAKGFDVAESVELRPYDEGGKLGNTVVIHQRDLGGWLKNTPERIAYDPPELGPDSSLELQRLVVWIRKKSWGAGDDQQKSNLEAFQRVITWYPQNEYQAIVVPEEVTDYSKEDTKRVARWKGRVALFDMKGKAWRGAVAIDLSGDPVALKQYAYFDASGRQVGAASNDAARDVHRTRRSFQMALERATTVALKSKKPIDSLAQVAPKSSSKTK